MGTGHSFSLAGQAQRVFVAFNNHYQAKAVVNARMLLKLLAEAKAES